MQELGDLSRLSEYHTENVYRSLIKDRDKNRKEKKNVTHLFNIAFIKMILNKLNAGCKVGRIELIGNIPSQGAEFAALLKNSRGKA